MMAVNFLHHLFQTKIECSAVSSDSYSPQNLASQCWREQSRGFLASHFIKPPVCLLFQLPFPINVYSLVLKPKVGSQISSGIDVFVAGVKHDSLREIAVKKDEKYYQKSSSSSLVRSSSNININSKNKKRKTESGSQYTGVEIQELMSQCDEEKSKNFEVFAHKYSTAITPDSFKNEHKNVFTLVSRVYEPLGRTIKIINKRYGGQMSSAIGASGDGVVHDFFQAHTLNYVTHIVVVISRVNGSCVPGIGRLEIWGQASACCGAYIKNYVSDMQKKIVQKENVTSAPDVIKKENNISTDGVTVKDDRKESRRIEDDDIPSEFIDPITCSLMTIPMLLPSGINIDLSTLEKHIEAEKSWGRIPSDPFTGLLFSNDLKPLPNAALKVRIDKYILTSGVDVRSCGRTVGGARGSIFSKGNLQENFSCGRVLDGKVNHTLLLKKAKEKCTDNKRDEEVLRKQEPYGHKKEYCVSQDTEKDIVQSHEEKVSESLDSALMKTLGGVSFTRRGQSVKETVEASLPCASSLVENLGKQAEIGALNKTSTSKVTQNHKNNFISSDCIGCKTPLNGLSIFQLPCQHLICRKCLRDQSGISKTLKCYSCGCAYEQKDVTRVHH